MCYHNSLEATPEELEIRYNRPMANSLFEPIYHTTSFPSKKGDDVNFVKWPVIALHEPDAIQMFYWGFIPPHYTNSIAAYDWLKQYPTYNAKGEELATKRTYAPALKELRRCLVPSTGFFEYHHNGAIKTPYFIHLKDSKIFSMAGLYSHWGDEHTGDSFGTFSIITCAANPMMEYIHNTKKRMPVILSPDDEATWLDYDTPPTIIQNLIKPYPQSQMQAHTVGNKLWNQPLVAQKVEYTGLQAFNG